MARTRAQEHPNAPKREYAPKGSKPQGRATATDLRDKTGHKAKKRKAEAIENTDGEDVKGPQCSFSKKSKTADPDPPQDAKPSSSAIDMGKLDALLSSYGVHPLQDTSLDEQNKATPETVLSLLYLAMLSSARISHELAYKSLQCLIEAGYQNIEILKKSTWEERTEVLTRGGYTRYREKTATALGELADFIVRKYGMLYLAVGYMKAAPNAIYEYR